MASLVASTKSQCPSSKIVLSGYSQGAMVVHNAFRQGVASSDIAGAVLFGDPLKSQTVGDLGAAKTKQFCASADTICGGGNDLQGTHLSYGSVAGEAADFIAGIVGGA
jgi:cutinase